MRLILLGPPGAGKGTQAIFLKKEFHFTHVNTGEILREEYAKKTELGIQAAQYWLKGNLTPQRILLQIFEKHLPQDNFILDGFPRTLSQARWLAKKRTIDKAIYITSQEKLIIQRLLKRAKLEGRKDDTLAVIKKRLHVYKNRTKPLLHYYKKNLIRINGDQSIPDVSNEIVKKLQ